MIPTLREVSQTLTVSQHYSTISLIITSLGWLYGIKDGKYGLFPADYVDKLSPRSIRKEIKSISKITQSSSARR